MYFQPKHWPVRKQTCARNVQNSNARDVQNSNARDVQTQNCQHVVQNMKKTTTRGDVFTIMI